MRIETTGHIETRDKMIELGIEPERTGYVAATLALKYAGEARPVLNERTLHEKYLRAARGIFADDRVAQEPPLPERLNDALQNEARSHEELAVVLAGVVDHGSQAQSTVSEAAAHMPLTEGVEL